MIERSSTVRGAVRAHAEAILPAAVSLALGLATLGSKAWWFDEAYNVQLAREGWGDYLAKTASHEPSQALYLVLFKVWRALTPESEFFTRLPSVLAAAVAAALVGVLGRRLFDQRTGVVAGLLTATNATVVAWSQQTRTYALATVFAIALTLLLVRALDADARRPWLLYGATGALGLYAHFFVGFVLASHLVLWPWLERARRRRLAEAWAVVAVAVAPVLPFAAGGANGAVDWIEPTTLGGIRAAVSEASGLNRLALLAAAAGAVVLLARRSTRLEGLLLAAWAVVPLAAALAVSVLQPVLLGRYLIVIAPALALLGAAAIMRIRAPLLAGAAGAAVLAVSARAVDDWYGAVHEGWRDAASVAERAQRAGTAVAVQPVGKVVAYGLYAPLPPRCRPTDDVTEPHCRFRASGRRTVLVTTRPHEWRRLRGAHRYVVASRQSFGDRLWVLHLRRAP